MNDAHPARNARPPIVRRRMLQLCALAVVLPTASTAHARGLGFTHDSYAMDTASDLTKALVLSGAVTAGLKLTVQRTRPNGGPLSFPSGHTSAAFAVAPILASRYGWKAGVPAYTLAIMTSLGRMEDRKHYASDVIAGATVGLVVGNAVAHHRSTQLMAEHVYMGKRGLGLKFGF